MAGVVSSTLTEQLRQAIRDCGLTPDQLAEATGVPQISIVYFTIGKDMGIKEASKIAKYFGLELRPAN
jgi:predicted transcriptional regulator